MKRAVETRGEAETCALAAALAREFPDRRVYALTGEMGSGKTCFVRGLAGALGIAEPVTSPTYALAHEYARPGGGRLVHLDFYRLRGSSDALALGWDDYLDDPRCVVAAEWAARAGDLIPPGALRLTFEAGSDDERRRITVEWD